METTVERTAEHTVKLTIEVPSEQLAKDLDKTYRAIAREVKIPGFRPGKAPKPIIDAQVGADVVLEEFVSSSVPRYFRTAVTDEDLAPIDGLDLLAGNDDTLAKVMDLGGTGGILVSSHLIGREMRRMIDEPDARWEIQDQIADMVETLMTLTSNPIPLKAALNMLGHDVGGLRLPLVEASDGEKARIRTMLERHGLLSAV